MPLTLLGRRLHPRACLSFLRLAARALVDAQAAEVDLLARPREFPVIARQLAALRTPVAQADVVETSLRALALHNWRRDLGGRLRGHGLEIGPLHRPMELHPGVTVDYVDRSDLAGLRAEYPELVQDGWPLVEPTFIDDAATLASVPDGRYDFLIASHVIEHLRNPIGALRHWCRVVAPGGLVYLVVPDKRETFDRTRVRTTLEHLILDDLEPSAERDFEHYLDYAVHVDGQRGEAAIAHARHLRATGYSIHFHVFQPTDLLRLVEWFAAHVRPVNILEGPAMEPGGDEFHLLLGLPPA